MSFKWHKQRVFKKIAENPIIIFDNIDKIIEVNCKDSLLYIVAKVVKEIIIKEKYKDNIIINLKNKNKNVFNLNLKDNFVKDIEIDNKKEVEFL